MSGPDLQKRVERVVFESFYPGPVTGSTARLAVALLHEFPEIGAPPAPTAHRGELERQLGDPARAADLMRRARAAGHGPVRLDEKYIAYIGLVWTKVRLRQPAVCEISLIDLPPGEWAYRQLSEVSGRTMRVAADLWAGL